MPFIVRWPSRVKKGTSGALVCQIDFLSSMASLTGQTLNAEDAPDSVDMLDALLGFSPDGRDHLVEQAGTLSLIHENWKYIAPSKRARMSKATNIELGNDPQPQLYDLKNDLGEKHDLAATYPEKVSKMAARLEKLREQGRSR